MDGQTGSATPMAVSCVARGWDQKTVTWFRASTTVNWTTEGIDRLASPVTKSTRASSFVNAWESISVTDHVKKWVASRATNYGFALAIDDGAVEWIDWASSEYGDVTKRPKLTVIYSSNTGPVGVRHRVQGLPEKISGGVHTDAYAVDGRRTFKACASGVRITQTLSGMRTVRVDAGR